MHLVRGGATPHLKLNGWIHRVPDTSQGILEGTSEDIVHQMPPLHGMSHYRVESSLLYC